jgi:hypothetical protein
LSRGLMEAPLFIGGGSETLNCQTYGWSLE